jgi:hypothetical protein
MQQPNKKMSMVMDPWGTIMFVPLTLSLTSCTEIMNNSNIEDQAVSITLRNPCCINLISRRGNFRRQFLTLGGMIFGIKREFLLHFGEFVIQSPSAWHRELS